LLRAVTTEQASFQMLEGHSRLTLPVLDGTPASFWQALPDAARNGFLEPLPGSGGQPLYLVFSVELMLVWVVVIFAVIRNLWPKHHLPTPDLLPPSASDPVSRALPHTGAPAFSAACITFALTGMLVIGFVVPFAGTIVRYRSIYLPFLLGPALHALSRHVAIQRLKSWLNNKLHFLI
jgi:hypothetical protein